MQTCVGSKCFVNIAQGRGGAKCVQESPGGTPYNCLYGEAPPERGTFFRLQVYKRVGISQVEVKGREIGRFTA